MRILEKITLAGIDLVCDTGHIAMPWTPQLKPVSRGRACRYVYTHTHTHTHTDTHPNGIKTDQIRRRKKCKESLIAFLKSSVEESIVI